VHLKWKTNLLNFNAFGSEYLVFDSSDYTFWATCVNATSEKVQVTQKDFINLMEDVKSSCLGFFLAILIIFLCFCVISLFIFCLKSSLISFWFCSCSKSSHSWANYKVSNIPFDGCYGHLLFTIWFQDDANDNFNWHIMLIKTHCCFEKLLELVKILEANWRTPKSWVEPTWGSNYVELWKIGTWRALPTSSTREG
jgi:hypothetical protein